MHESRKPLPTRYLNYMQAAEYLTMPVETLRSLVGHRKIPHARLGPRTVRFEAADLDRWIAEHKVTVSSRDRPDRRDAGRALSPPGAPR